MSRTRMPPAQKGRRFEKGADGLGKRGEVVGRERLFVHQSGEVEHFASRYRVDPCDALHQRVGAGVFGAVGQKGEGLRGQGFGRHAVERGRRLIDRPRVDGPHAILARVRGSQRPEDFVRLGVNENDIGISPDQFHDNAAIHGRANAVAFARDEMHNALVGDVFNADKSPHRANTDPPRAVARAAQGGWANTTQLLFGCADNKRCPASPKFKYRSR